MIRGYNIVETIHQGSPFVVFRARAESDKNTVIIKTLQEAYPKPLDIAKLHNEYKVLNNLGDVNGIPNALEFQSFENKFYLILKDHLGITLNRYYHEGTVSIASFLDFSVQISQILTRIHGCKIVHKDIRSSNIVVSPTTGQVELGDFSQASHLMVNVKEDVDLRYSRSSLPYMSPEQTGRMNRPLDHRSDLYSLGITFFEILTGELPFTGDHPLEWVHAHLAQPALDPRELRSNIPEPIALIILRLLAKNPEERYQKASNLLKDLKNCALQWVQDDRIKPFRLSAADTTGMYMTPTRLYGREPQIKQLSIAIEEVAILNKPKLILVSGYSGIGKTSLVEEAKNQITIARGNFVTGKFDQLNKSIPFHGFILAFTELANQLLAIRESDLARIKEQLLDALGANAQIVNQLVPAFKLILGELKPPPLLLPEETANRLLQVVSTFVRTLAHPKRPLIIFIDDLQWADLSSLFLLELLAVDEDLKSLGLICSYRSNEVNGAHPLSLALSKIRSNIQIVSIELENLSTKDVQEFLFDAFNRRDIQSIEFAKLLMLKTKGNPFFLIQTIKTLLDEKLIIFDLESENWNWNIHQLSEVNISDNVVELLVGRIRKLSKNAQTCLQLAACIGNKFSVRLLAGIVDNDVLSAIGEVLENGMIAALDGNYILVANPEHYIENFYQNDQEIIEDAKFRFLHDRIQQAAYSLLPTHKIQKIHLRLGQHLSTNLDKKQRTESLFIICNHLNKAKELITDTVQRLELIELNHQAAIAARRATAYAQAMVYAEIGISLSDQLVAVSHELRQGLHHELALCYYLTSNLKLAEREYRNILKKSLTRSDKLLVYRDLVSMYSSIGQHSRVATTIGEAFKLFDVQMPTNPIETRLRIMASIAKIAWSLRSRKLERRAVNSIDTNPDNIKLSELLLESSPSIYLFNLDLFAWNTLFGARLGIRYGSTPSTALGFMGYGMVLNAVFRSVNAAFNKVELGEEISSRFKDDRIEYKLKFGKHLFLSHFRLNVIDYYEQFQRLGKQALEVGDYVYLGLSHYNQIALRLALGHPLEEIVEESGRHLKQLELLKNTYGYDLTLIRYQGALALRSQPMLPWELGDPEATMETKLHKFQSQQLYSNITMLLTSVYQMHCLLDHYEEDISVYVTLGFKYLIYLNETYPYVDFALYQSLSILKIVRKDKNRSHKKNRRMVKTHMKALKIRAKTAPENYAHYYTLVSSIYSLINKQETNALKSLEELLTTFEELNIPHLSAIVKELIGDQYFRNERMKFATVYLKESAYEYSRWGATAKIMQMHVRYPFLDLNKDYDLDKDTLSVEANQNLGSGKNDLDLASLMKSVAGISSEIVLNRLLPAMISIVVENAGAQFGYLILEKRGELVIAVKRDEASETAEILNDIPVAHCEEVARSVIQYAYRTQDNVLVDKAGEDERFNNDPRVTQVNAKSILCVPILHNNKFRGALYLENNLVTYAFSPERVSVMKILSAQIAVALDNASLYSDLEEALDKQIMLTEAYSRFTPKEYIKFLGHKSILDVNLGDYRTEQMIVLFCDIRSYTTIAEQFNAKQNFQFLSKYMERMTKIIIKGNGMVSQLLGDGILAFFPNANDALNASIEMQVLLHDYQAQGSSGISIPIKAGIGLHAGEVIIGIVGNSKRMDTGIVSDTVNAASRIEGMTKHYGVKILLSEAVEQGLPKLTRDRLRFIGRVKMKGKSHVLGLFECFEGDEVKTKQSKSTQIDAYHDAVKFYRSGQFEQSNEAFSRLIRLDDTDPVYKLYQQKSIEMVNTVIPENWDAIETMDIK